MADLDQYLEEHHDRFEEELCQLLRIPSVSTDGLHDVVSDGSILEAMSAGFDASRTAKMLVELALAKGGADNVSALSVRIRARGAFSGRAA